MLLIRTLFETRGEITIRFVSECGGCSSLNCMRVNCFFNIYKISPSMFEKLYRTMVLNWNCVFSLQDVLPSLLPYCHQVMGGRDQASHQLTIHLLTHVTQQKAPPPTDGSELAQLQAYMMDFGVTKKLVHFLLHFFFTFVCCFFFFFKKW